MQTERLAILPLATVVALGIGGFSAATCAEEAWVDALGLQQAQVAQPASASAPASAPAPATQQPAADAAITTPPAEAPAPRAAFGTKDSLRLDIEGDGMWDFENAEQFQGRIGLAWFCAQNVELAFYATGGYVWQDGGNAGTYGFDVELRWHFLAREEWSLFGSIGGGVMGSTRSVPSDGSPFNFTPSLGLGGTYEVAPDTRLYAEARWYHISNAQTYVDNPGRDNLGIWVGLSFAL
jgi:hypothetical protein